MNYRTSPTGAELDEISEGWLRGVPMMVEGWTNTHYRLKPNGRGLVSASGRKMKFETVLEVLAALIDAGGQEAAIVRYVAHTGRCALCGRELTAETSVDQGIGPVCAKKWLRHFGHPFSLATAEADEVVEAAPVADEAEVAVLAALEAVVTAEQDRLPALVTGEDLAEWRSAQAAWDALSVEQAEAEADAEISAYINSWGA